MSVHELKPFDQRLRSAMAEIEPILEKYEVGGQVDLVWKTHVEYRLFVPKWVPHTKDLAKGKAVYHLRKNNPEGTRLVVHFLSSLTNLTMQALQVQKQQMDVVLQCNEVEHWSGPTVRSPENLGRDELDTLILEANRGRRAEKRLQDEFDMRAACRPWADGSIEWRRLP